MRQRLESASSSLHAHRSQQDGIHALSAHIAATLPDLSRRTLRQCFVHRPGSQLSSCVHLSNPASGSTWLADVFRRHSSLQNVSFFGQTMPRTSVFPLPTKVSPVDMMHTHAMGVADIQRWLRANQLPPARCFVMTLRDPAERFASAFRDSYMHAERLTHTLGGKANRTASELIARLRRPFNEPQLPLPGGRLGWTSAWLYAHSAAAPQWRNNWHYPGPVNGSLFLTSQLEYLRGVDCNTMEIRLLCQERLSDDWRRLLRLFGEPPGYEPPMRVNIRRSNASGPPARGPSSGWQPGAWFKWYATRRSHLSERDRVFVREELYPWDSRLHDWVCAGQGTQEEGSAGGGGSSSTRLLATYSPQL